MIKRWRVKWTGDVAGRGEKRNAYKGVIEKSTGNRLIRRLGCCRNVTLKWT
jgi:hypothetical protein